MAGNALILTGGKGTRMRPLTLYVPKPLLPVGNVPFLSYPLSLLRSVQVRNVALCTADSEKPYLKFIREQKKLGTAVVCSREFKELGTGGAIKNAEKFVGDSTFIFNGDALTDINLEAMLKFHVKQKSDITIAVIPVPDPSSYGLVLMEPSGKIKKFVEKPSVMKKGQKTWYINAGMYIFEKKIFDLIPRSQKFSVERELFPDCLDRGLSVYGFRAPASTYWIDTGTPQKYMQSNRDVLNGSLSEKNLPKGIVARGQKSAVHRTARVGRDVVIGKRCKVGAKSSLKNCVLLDDVQVEDEVALENCIIGSHVRIGHHSSILNSKMIGNDSIITPYSQL